MLFAILSAILLILSFPNFNLPFLAFVCFLPLFFAIHGRSPKKAFLISYLCGFLFYLGTLYWIFRVTFIGMVVLCVYLALYFGVFGLLISLIYSTKRKNASCLTSHGFFLFIPLIWIVLEYLQAHLLTGFGWTLLGYSQYKNLAFIQIADFSGVYGVSFAIMLVNIIAWTLAMQIVKPQPGRAPAHWKKSLHGSIRPLFSIVLIFVVIDGYGFFRLNTEDYERTVKISVIQGNIPQEIKWDIHAAEDILTKYTKLTELAAQDKPDLIIWPETSFPGFLVIDEKLTDRLLKLVRRMKIPILLGANTNEGLRYFNSAVLISERGRIQDKYDKLHLVPFGEFVPFSQRFPFLHRLVLGELGEFTPGKEYKIFESKAAFAVLICFEDVFPELARGFLRNGAEFIVVITNDAWYGRSPAAYQHTACSVFRAIENRVPVVRSANTGYSCFIDSKGRIYDSVEENNSHLFITGYKTSLLKL